MSGNASEQAPLWFFENLDHINRAIQDTVVQGSTSPEDMLSVVLDTVLAIFQCDRAWLVYSCDPEAPKWSVPMERTRPDFPGRSKVQSRRVVLSHEASVHGLPAVRHSVAVRIASNMHRLRGIQCDSSTHVNAEWQAEFEREITLCCKS